LRLGWLYYWRDKSGRELDFVVNRGRTGVDTVECKLNPDHLDRSVFSVFRADYPDGRNYVVSPMVKNSYTRRYEAIEVICCGFDDPGVLF
jgi:predicted AAA+ superfamily ATPase